MKKVEGKITPWGGEEKAVLIPTQLEKSNLEFHTLWVGKKEKKDLETGNDYTICTVLVRLYDGSTNLGKYFVDGTTEGLGKKTDAGLEIYDKGICDVKDGKLTQVKGKE